MEDATVREGSRRFVFRLGAGVREFLRVLQAPDGGSRRLIAVLSLVFFAGALGFSFRALQHLGHFQANTKQNLEDCKEFKCTLQALEAKIQEEARLAAIRDSVVGFGEFEVAVLDAGAAPAGTAKTVLEMDVSVQFDSAETGRWVMANIIPIRGAVMNSVATLGDLTRADLMGARGKSVIRDRIRDRLTQSLPTGRIREVYFNSYVLK